MSYVDDAPPPEKQWQAHLMLDAIAAAAAEAGMPGPPPCWIDEDGWIEPQ